MQATRCDGWVNGCTGAGEHRTVTGGHLCDNCHDNRVADEAACMAGNGTPPPVAFTSWWRKLVHPA